MHTSTQCANVFSWRECTRGAVLFSGAVTSPVSMPTSFGTEPPFLYAFANTWLERALVLNWYVSPCCFLCKFDHSCERVRIYFCIFIDHEVSSFGKTCLSCYFSHIPTGFVFLNKNSLCIQNWHFVITWITKIHSYFYLIFPASWHES